MKLINPINITESDYTTNLTNAATDHSNFTDYAVDDLCKYNCRIWKALQESGPNSPISGGYAPPSDPDSVGNPYWILVSTANTCKPFDGVVADTSTNTGTIQYTFNFTNTTVTAITLINLVGSSVNVTVNDTSGTPTEVYNTDKDIVSYSSVYDWYSYFFEDVEMNSSVSFLDLPSQYTTIEVIVTISGEGTLELGEMVLGDIVNIGRTKKSLNLGITDYSLKTTDTYGNITIVPRGFSKTLECGVETDTENLNYINTILTSLRATPVVWIASESEPFTDALVVYGYMKDYELRIPHALWGEYSIKIEGLT